MLTNIQAAFHEGGIFMYVILAFGIFTFAFIGERAQALYIKYKAAPEGFRNQILNLLAAGKYSEAERLAMQSGTHIGNIIAVGCHIRAQGGAEEEVQARMDEQLTRELEIVDKRTAFLAMFGNVATLVGLLGTIVGMIHSFGAVASANPIDRATLLSKGIAEAMNCTAFGLIVAVPALVCYAIYQNKTDKIVVQITNSTTEMYHDLIFTFGKGASATASQQKQNHSAHIGH